MLELRHLSVRFSAQSAVQAVEDVSLTLHPGEKTAILGETGSGKSVLLLAALRLLPDETRVSGQVLFEGENLLELDKKQLSRLRGSRISYVPQGGGGSLNPLLTVGFQVGEPLIEHRGYTKRAAVRRSVALFESFQLGDERTLARAYPHRFSGGMRQRAMVAMGIAAGAKTILADEPTKGLDQKRIDLVADTFARLKEESLLCVTHDLPFARAVSRTVCVMYAAQQVESGPTDAVLREPLHPYVQDLVAALSENGMQCRSGFAPPHGAYESHTGCRYYDRCAVRTARCETEMPPFVTRGERCVRCWQYAD
ncbi:MAG: ABC transporter ATP-binding protein [Clostridia bacterium]|nr:ABC transporter ATP-binding protein [Clostridia bacterium]